MSLCPPNNPWQNSGQHSSNDNWLKAKQQCESGMRRRGSGNLRNLSKLRLVSRQLHASLAQRLAQTAPTVSRWDRSCLPSSTHLPGRTHSSGLATEGRSHQLRQRSSPLQTDALDPVLQEDPSESSPSAAPGHLQSRDFLENPARATQVFQEANAGHGQSDDVPENGATFHGAHGWARTRPFGTTDNKSCWANSQHLMALSQKTCPAPLPRKPFSSGKFYSTELSGAPDLHLSCLRWCPASQFSANSVRVPALAGPALRSALPTEKWKLWTDTMLLNPKRRKILTVHQRRQQLSLLLFAHGATQGHHLMPSGTNHSGSGIGHELICKRKKHGKNLEPTWNNTSKFLIQAQDLPSSNARSNSSLLRPLLWTASRASCWDLPTNGTRLLVTTMWRPLNCPSVSTPVDTSSFPDTPGIVSASTRNNTENEPLIWKNLQCWIESNQLSRTAVRGLFGARFVWLFFLSASSSAEVGAPTSNSEPDTSARDNSGSSPWTTGSPERLYTKTQQPHEVIFILESARSKTSPNRIHWLASKEILNSKANGNRWRFENSHCGRWAVSTTPSNTFFPSLLRRRISESVNTSDSYPESPTSSTPPTTSTSSSSSSSSASVPASVSHKPPTSIGPSRPPAGLSSPLSPATLSSKTTTGEGEPTAWTADLLSTWDELISARKMTLSSDIFYELLRRTWLISYYMVDL